MNSLSPDTYLYGLVDLREVRSLRNITPRLSPIVGIYDELLETPGRTWKYPRTMEGTRKYFSSLSSTICGARHERHDNDITVPNCPVRACNIACLHGADFTRHPDGHIQFGTDMWAARVFATAYVMDKLGYSVPLFFDNFPELNKKMYQYDEWEMNNIFADELYPSSNPDTEAFQRAISGEFQTKYIDPIHQAFLDFWDSHVWDSHVDETN